LTINIHIKGNVAIEHMRRNKDQRDEPFDLEGAVASLDIVA